MNSRKTFSIVIPIGPNFANIEQFAENLCRIDFPKSEMEFIIVSDKYANPVASENLVNSLSSAGFNTTRLQNDGKAGPGIARNIGVVNAKYSYILFIDSDDRISPNILKEISAVESTPDIIFFNFRRIASDQRVKSPGRKDTNFFAQKNQLIEGALKNQTEQECWQASYNRDFLMSNSISFLPGFYEDIRFNLFCLTRMESFVLLSEVLYEKIETLGSVTSIISADSISNYLTAWLEMATLAKNEIGKASENSLKIGLQNIVGHYVHRIATETKCDGNQIDLVNHLLKKVKDQRTIPEFSSARNTLPTLYSDIFKFVYNESKSYEEILNFVMNRRKLEWSCGDIENSVFLAPNEIRTCCKRFFVNGKIAGDVVLNVKVKSDTKELKKVTTAQIIDSKQELKRKINIGNQNECTGCPYLELKEWKNRNSSFELKYLSMEQHSICNLRCTYCDDKYYGGLNPDYDVAATLDDLHQNQVTSNLKTVVWGGGEPTLDPNFASMLKGVRKVAPNCEHRFLSNSKRFSQEIYDALKIGHSQLVTSIDAGSDSKYLEIRGRKGYSEVLQNLKKYSEIGNHSLVIKYIFTLENQEFTELDSFVADIIRFKLTRNIFQISYDFKSEVIDGPGLLACLSLFTLLYNAGAHYIYFDDLLLTRFRIGSNSGVEAILDDMRSKGIDYGIGKPADYEDITLYGAGDQAERMVRKFNLLDRFSITSVVENNTQIPEKIFHGLPVKNLEVLKTGNSKILLAGVQGVPQMLKSLQELGIEQNRIIRELLI